MSDKKCPCCGTIDKNSAIYTLKFGSTESLAYAVMALGALLVYCDLIGLSSVEAFTFGGLAALLTLTKVVKKYVCFRCGVDHDLFQSIK